MSQQSVTFLSQPANLLFKDPKPIGGTARFKAGPAGSLIRKMATVDLKDTLRDQRTMRTQKIADENPISMTEYHYSVLKNGVKERIRLGCNDIPAKPVGAIPGYSGFAPRKEAANVIGTTYKMGNLMAAELFAQEQEVTKSLNANIVQPNPNLTTPHTGDY